MVWVRKKIIEVND